MNYKYFFPAQLHRKSLQNQNKHSQREWMCFYCKEGKAQNIADFVFSTVDEVYEHWLIQHDGNHATAAAAAKQTPFRFYSVDLLHCSMDACRYFSTFLGLQRHHQKKHPNDLFVAVLNGRCALCLRRDALHEHACDSLQNGMQLKLYNPVLLSDDDLAELQAIKCEKLEQNRPKPIECQHCGCIFDTREQMTQHHHQQHA